MFIGSKEKNVYKERALKFSPEALVNEIGYKLPTAIKIENFDLITNSAFQFYHCFYCRKTQERVIRCTFKYSLCKTKV